MRTDGTVTDPTAKAKIAQNKRMTEARKRRCAEDPDYAERLRAASAARHRAIYHRDKDAANARVNSYRKTEAGKEMLRRKWRKTANRRRAFSAPDEILAIAAKSLPPGLPQHIRDDVIGSVALACLEGTLRINDIAKRIGEHLRAYNRQYDARRFLSLDAVIPGTDMTYMARLTAGGPDD